MAQRIVQINGRLVVPVEEFEQHTRPEDAQFLHRESFRGELEFRGVSFAYPGRDDPALREVSFRVQAGGGKAQNLRP